MSDGLHKALRIVNNLHQRNGIFTESLLSFHPVEANYPFVCYICLMSSWFQINHSIPMIIFIATHPKHTHTTLLFSPGNRELGGRKVGQSLLYGTVLGREGVCLISWQPVSSLLRGAGGSPSPPPEAPPPLTGHTHECKRWQWIGPWLCFQRVTFEVNDFIRLCFPVILWPTTNTNKKCFPSPRSYGTSGQ